MDTQKKTLNIRIKKMNISRNSVSTLNKRIIYTAVVCGLLNIKMLNINSAE